MSRLLISTLLVCLCTPAALAMYSASGPVVDLTPSNLKSKIKGSGGVWLVEFYAPWCGHCKNLKPAWEEAAKALRGIAGVGAVDADQHKELGGEYQIKGFPTIKLMYADDSGNIKAQDYNGGRSAKDFVTFAVDKAKTLALKRLGEKSGGGGGSSGGGAKGGDSGSAGGGGGADSGFYAGTQVVTLSDSNFAKQVTQSTDLWFVEFYAPWCGHCKSLKPTWIEVAEQLQGKVKFGAVDCTVHQSVCSEYGVKGYPTLKWFGASKGRPEDYNGGRDSGSITAFASDHWAAQAPPPEVKELDGPAAWAAQCAGDDKAKAKRLCLLAFLPDVLDSRAAGRKAYIKTLEQLADAYKDKPYGYLWAAGGQQAGIESSFGVGGFGYPAFVAYNPSDKKYTVCKSAFEFKHVKDWLDSMRMGGAALPLSGPLPEIRSYAAWDGQDAQEVIEDEFSLDDILGDGGKEEL